ncbi:Uncharacterised protein [Clostridium tertium]|uniref:Uncharacterized protein n=1 Tax=Clostridium tertium TaxID=1559 RepID=A0A6N3D982_9CLOT
MEKTKIIKKLGIGSLSLITSIIAIIFSFTSFSGKSIGEELLSAIGIKFPSLIISTLLFILSIFIGYKKKDNKYSELGMTLSIIFIVIIILSTIISIFFK